MDAYLGERPEVVRDAAKRVAQREGLSEDWLNDGVKGFFYGTPPQTTLADFPGLRVYSVTPEYMVAMKAVAGRPEDIADLRYLVRFLHITSSEQILNIVEQYIPPRLLTTKIQYIAESLFDGEKNDESETFEAIGSTSKKSRKQTCSIRCQTSIAPVSSCHCVCSGKNHGIKARK